MLSGVLRAVSPFEGVTGHLYLLGATGSNILCGST